jgi:hypothetical protein
VSTVALAFTCIESMFSRFFADWLQVEIGPPSEVPRHCEVGGPICEARNNSVRWFLEQTSADYLVMIDQDHRLPANFLERIAGYTEPVVGALYPGRGAPHVPVAMIPNPHWRESDEDPYEDLRGDEDVWAGNWEGGKIAFLHASATRQALKHPALYRVCVVGAGCLAIRRDVLADWPPYLPWFTFGLSDEGAIVGEDVWFCRQVAKRGLCVYVDSGLQLPHMTVSEITFATYERELRRLATQNGVPYR